MTFASERANRMQHLLILASAPYASTPPKDLYFIQAGTDGPVKIGVATDVHSRLAALQTANADRLRLIGHQPGVGLVERTLHAALAGDRMAGEWFRPSPAVLAAAQGFAPENILWLPSLVPGGKPWRYVTADNAYFINEAWHHRAGASRIWRTALEFVAHDLLRYSTVLDLMNGLDQEAAA